ncbi:hypothetical protein LTR66_004474 [Elasticomyces elasticus]|nr:hypothetical protein LTR66_004474 [Elasticomyces elasticus]
MIDWTRRIGYEPSDFDRLNPIHIAGTKGKGSTSAFVSSILYQYAKSKQHDSAKTHKVGLYTSPHLRFVRERIQINNEPLSEAAFARYFFETWDRLEESARAAGHPDPSLPETKPVYFRFLTLMALHCYMEEGVDVAVIECGIGGEYDSTNILVKPSVTGITSLGIDHTAMLGETIDSIAWHKAGIFKPGVPALTAPQPDTALLVLKERAIERGTELQIVQQHPEIDSIQLGLAADFQKTNASLAIAIASAHLRQSEETSLPHTLDMATTLSPVFRVGLEQVRLGGRCEVRQDDSHNITWHIDGGHTLESIELSAEWFASRMSARGSIADTASRVLIFNQQTRDAASLARKLHSTLGTALNNDRPFTHAIFCTNTTFSASGFRPDLVSVNTNKDDLDALSVQHRLAATWEDVDPACDVKVVRTIEEAVAAARAVAKGEGNRMNVLVTGSLHLVGGLVEVLETETGDGGQ